MNSFISFFLKIRNSKFFNGLVIAVIIASALYGDSAPDESGGRINVNLYKSGDIGTAGANDFYMAEGIYLLD